EVRSRGARGDGHRDRRRGRERRRGGGAQADHRGGGEELHRRQLAGQEAGIQLGDVIVALDGESIDNTPQLQQKVAFKKPGETVEITVLRQGGEKRTVTVRLARAPSEADSEVAAASSKAKGEAASSKEEMLGI